MSRGFTEPGRHCIAGKAVRAVWPLRMSVHLLIAVRPMAVIRAPRSLYPDSSTLLGGVACRLDRTEAVVLVLGHEGWYTSPLSSLSRARPG